MSAKPYLTRILKPRILEPKEPKEYLTEVLIDGEKVKYDLMCSEEDYNQEFMDSFGQGHIFLCKSKDYYINGVKNTGKNVSLFFVKENKF